MPLKNKMIFAHILAINPKVLPRLVSKIETTIPMNPKRVVQNPVLIRTQKYLNQSSPLIPIKSATASGKSIDPSLFW